nr:MAG TPA: hypothetical protein [Caudoviricetes sp.]
MAFSYSLLKFCNKKTAIWLLSKLYFLYIQCIYIHLFLFVTSLNSYFNEMITHNHFL